ncbi:hypothetical protein [Nocardioides sp.]|jgi:hypothetical protein|uniref:hypothetical protein n=1 Tax=Nocardioides sp. TaxID=35761 RepID=UPI002612D3CD|nr:hypothetical protein [Nocardioides sp.]
MLGNQPFVSPLSGLLTRLRDWPVAAQQQARRNAMVAATACAQRRIEREEVADFLESRRRPSTGAADSPASSEPAGQTPPATAHG